MIERIEINLLPAEYRIHRKHLHVPREVIYPLIVLVITCIAIALWSININSSIEICKNQIKVIEQQINVNKPIQKEIDSLRSSQLLVEDKIRALERISVNREQWVRLMEEFSKKLPEFTWLVSIKEQNSIPPVVQLEGRTYSFPEVANYMSGLKESEYVNDVDLLRMEQIDPQSRLFAFSISCKINPDAGLKTGNDL